MPNTADIVRSLEVRGSLAAMGDLGLIKCASSEEEINDLTEKVASVIPEYGYTTEDILNAATYFTSGGYEKTASEQYESDIKEALGELLLMKVAGDIDTETFQQEADPLVKEAISLKGVSRGLKRMGLALQDGFTARSFRNSMKRRAAAKRNAAHNATQSEFAGANSARRSSLPSRESMRNEEFTNAMNAPRQGTAKTKIVQTPKIKGLGRIATAYGLAGTGLAGLGYAGKKLTE